MPDLPELGFNFEVAYEVNMLTIDPGGGEADLGLNGINVTTGAVYFS